MAGLQLPSRPGGYRLGIGRTLAVPVLKKFTVSVAADPGNAIAEAKEPIKNLARVRPGRCIAQHDDTIGSRDVLLGQNRFECRKHTMDVGQDGNALRHRYSLPSYSDVDTYSHDESGGKERQHRDWSWLPKHQRPAGQDRTSCFDQVA